MIRTLLCIISVTFACTAFANNSSTPENGAQEPSAQENVKAEKYEHVSPEEFNFVMKDVYHTSRVSQEDGEAVGMPTGGEIGTLLCNGEPLALTSNKFQEGFIVTKQFGKIKVRTSLNVFSAGFSIFLTKSQKDSLRKFLTDKKTQTTK